MHIPAIVVVIVLALIVYIAWGQIECSRCKSVVARMGSASFHDRDFQMSLRAYVLPLLGVFISVWSWLFAGITHAPTLCKTMAAFFGALSLYLLYCMRRTSLSIQQGKVAYTEGGKIRWTIRLAEITEVRLISSRSNTRIGILTGGKKIYGMAAGFKQEPLLLAMLRQYRPKIEPKERLQILAEKLTQLVEILRLDSNCQWRAHFESNLAKIQELLKTGFTQGDLDGLSAGITGFYGGLGSFSDYGPVVFDVKSGKSQTIATTEEFDGISKSVFEEATALCEK